MARINPDRLLKDLRRHKFNRRSFMRGMAATGLISTMISVKSAKADPTITVFE